LYVFTIGVVVFDILCAIEIIKEIREESRGWEGKERK
jgi:hypothetical protein